MNKTLRNFGLAIAIVFSMIAMAFPAMAQLTINVTVNGEDGASVPDFRWLVEEDNTTFHDPDNIHGDAPGAPHSDVLSLQFHKSYAPIVSNGCVGDATQSDNGVCGSGAITLPDTGRYFLSILPYDGHRLTGLSINADALTADPTLSRNFDLQVAGLQNVATGNIEVPTAQMTIFAFLDEAPLNNAPDDGEPGLQGFKVLIEDAGGKYGASGGQLVADVFGNALGTTYLRTPTGEYAAFDAEGVPIIEVLGTGELLTGSDGFIVVRNLAPAKYGVRLVQPSNGIEYQQTTTIEGTTTFDAWLLPDEAPFYIEGEAPQPYHVFIGFTRRTPLDPAYQTGSATVTGVIHSMHTPRVPDVSFNFGPAWHIFNGASACWIGVNDLSTAGGVQIMAEPCQADSSFTLPNLADGSYQLIIWDKFLDGIIGFYPLTVTNGECSATGVNPSAAACDLGRIGLFPWFARIDNYVFFDTNENGVMDDGEPGIPEQAVLLRFRDGTIYQEFPTDLGGYVPFDQVFPFFHWLVTEVDFGRFKATGVTTYVDDGGELDVNAPGSRYGDIQNPQLEGYDGTAGSGTPFRTDLDSTLTQAFQSFLGSTSVLEWGKANYGPGESGGISGIVYYGVTRAEDDPKNAAAEPWEPGIPRVQLALYLPCPNPGATPVGGGNPTRDAVCETVLDPESSTWVNGTRRKAAGPNSANFANRPFRDTDIDNYPFNFQFCTSAAQVGVDPNCPATVGPEDIDNDGDGRFDPTDAVAITWTDSWDDNTPESCPASKLQIDAGTADGTQAPFTIHPGTADEFDSESCFDGLRPFNQIRPGVFDGGYAFETYNPNGASRTNLAGNDPLIDGDYVVRAITPPLLKHLTSQARNVDFGEIFGANTNGYSPTLAALPFDCAGDKYLVPDELTLFPGVAAPLAGTYQSLCDMRAATVRVGMSGGGFNAGAEFWMYTDVPKAARIVGLALDDLANSDDINNPTFGEKYAPPFLPISIRDYTGTEITRVYTDEFGTYNALVPSTFSMNLPSQSGISPNMLQACLNDPVKPDGTFDPAFKPVYGQVCWTLQYVPGSTTYLDTPIFRLSAFASNEAFPLDCECSDQTPVIHHVENGSNTGTFTRFENDSFQVIAMGDTLVPNPDYDQNIQPSEILRDFGFGATPGIITIGGVTQTITTWTNNMIEFDRNPASPATGDLVIERDNGAKTTTGVQIIYEPDLAVGLWVVEQGDVIQDALDFASAGDVVLVKSGRYDESLILTKNLRLQGVGARATVINGKPSPASRVSDWQSDVANRVASGEIDLLPGQAFNTVPEVLLNELAAPLSVFGRGSNGVAAVDSDFTGASADGLFFTGSISGGGVFINAYVPGFTLSNNIVAFNHGDFGGGIRIGLPSPSEDTVNDNITMRNNRVVQNGGGFDRGGEGPGGIAIYAGADGYLVRENMVCGNFSVNNGAGIGHIGLSDDGRIEDNRILFNQSFNQSQAPRGGGLYLSGIPQTGAETNDGAGDVLIARNLIQGNQAGAGDGGAIATNAFNGLDADPNTAPATYQLSVVNNTIVNNVTGGAGTILLDDVANGQFLHNTIAFNESTATTAATFTGPNGLSESVRQVSGVYSLLNSTELTAVLPGTAPIFSSPEFRNNIVWQNLSCLWTDDVGDGSQGIVCEDAGSLIYDEFAVQANAGCLDVDNSVVTNLADADICPGATSNVDANPAFIGPSFLAPPSTDAFIGERAGRIEAFAAFDEGGNFIDVSFGLESLIDEGGQLTQKGDFHISTSSSALDIGAIVGVVDDIDGDLRPFGSASDAGSDEVTVVGSNSIVIATAEIESILSATKVRIQVVATSDLGSEADLTMTIRDANNLSIVENLPMAWKSLTSDWQRLRAVKTTKFTFPYTVTVQGAEGTAIATVSAP